MAEWYEEWFASEEYLTVYKHRDDSDAKILFDLISRNINAFNFHSVLDLPCGTGRHSVLFAENGFEVTGVDLSAPLLNIGIERAKNLGLAIKFINEDMRNLSFRKKFDVVVNLFTSFGYFITDEENFGLFETAYRFLVKGGVFVFDYLNPQFVKDNLKKYSVDIADGTKIEQIREIDDGRVVKEIKIQGPGKNKRFFESVKLYESDVLLDELVKTGFTILNTYGSYTGEVFNKKDSKRLIIFAEK